MHVLPLPFGMALALMPRRKAEALGRPKSFRREPAPARDRVGTESRCFEYWQRLI